MKGLVGIGFDDGFSEHHGISHQLYD